MKVYVATGLIAYEGIDILGVFVSRELAQEFLNTHHPKRESRTSEGHLMFVRFGDYDDVGIEEYEVEGSKGANIDDAGSADPYKEFGYHELHDGG